MHYQHSSSKYGWKLTFSSAHVRIFFVFFVCLDCVVPFCVSLFLFHSIGVFDCMQCGQSMSIAIHSCVANDSPYILVLFTQFIYTVARMSMKVRHALCDRSWKHIYTHTPLAHPIRRCTHHCWHHIIHFNTKIFPMRLSRVCNEK